jgi:EAL domain-containing protein (putative c-di-GMP-specific phosphodiesterase class I)/FixJ family two-component response regulator
MEPGGERVASPGHASVTARNIDDRRLLVLDDDEAVGATVALIAKAAGFTVYSTTLAEDFFAKIETWSPSHVIVDLRMPGTDGVGVLKWLAMRETAAAVIVTSGLGARILESAARAAVDGGLNVIGVLSKPFKARTLRELLDTEIRPAERRRRAERQPTSADTSDVSRETLSRALEGREIGAFYQPKISCATRALMGFEALARWPSPDHGMIMPDRFIPLAEQSGLIGELTRQVFEAALSWFAGPFGGSEATLALNLSARLLSDPELPIWISACCAKYSVPHDQLILEVTETASMNNQEAVVENLTKIRISGFRLSIDDFGVGYSSLVQLARLPFSELKIDKMFILSARTSEESRKIISSIVGLSRALDLHVTAEGVEDEWTLDFLQKLGCDSAQGYVIARPMDGAAAVAWSASFAPLPKALHE